MGLKAIQIQADVAVREEKERRTSHLWG